MAYKWEIGEKIPDGIERLMKELVDFTLEQLKDESNDRDEAVHDARKSFKKLRAILRLVRFEIGEEEYQKQNMFYRDLARQLSPLRDAFVLVEIMDNLIKELDDKDLKKVAKIIRKDLNSEFLKTKEAFWSTGEAVSEVIAALEAERDKVGQIGIERDSFKVFQKGLDKIYRQGQGRMEIAYANVPASEGFHDWRKRVKYLWYQLRIIESVYPAELVAINNQLDQLSDLLGNAHDLAVLYEKIEDHPETQDGTGRQLLAYLDHKRGELEASARPFGEAIYTMDSKDFIKQIKNWWKNPEPILA